MLKKYLINNFFNSFFTLFSILFILASMVLLLTISNVTAVLKINLGEFIYLYILSLPEIVFYTLPLTFFITAALSIARLFENLELITVLALGTSPKKILRPFLVLSLFLTFFLLVITFLSIPTSQILYKNFINIKKTESQFNFSASSIGQKFGNWNLFISGKNGNQYKNVILYNPEKNTFITAATAETYRVGNYFVLALSNGRIYSKGKEKLSEIKFERFHLNKRISTTDVSLDTISEYIKQYKDKTNKYFLIAFFPLVSFFFLAGISFFHYRYEKNHSVIYSLSIAIAYYVTVFIVYKNLYAVFFIVPTFILISRFINKKAKRF